MELTNSVQEYIDRSGPWKESVTLLREIITAEDVNETLKWGTPTYTVNGKNVIGIGAFKSYVGLWFHQGALLKDKNGLLINASEGVTKALRQLRFNSLEEIKDHARVIRAFVREAIENQKNGLEIKPAKKKPIEIPDQLKELLNSDDEVKNIFYALPPSHQREYAEYISEAKKEETKRRRIDKIKPMILSNKGLNDKYRK